MLCAPFYVVIRCRNILTNDWINGYWVVVILTHSVSSCTGYLASCDCTCQFLCCAQCYVQWLIALEMVDMDIRSTQFYVGATQSRMMQSSPKLSDTHRPAVIREGHLQRQHRRRRLSSPSVSAATASLNSQKST